LLQHVDHYVCVDAADEARSNWTRFVNDGPRSGLKPNVRFDHDGTIIALRHLHSGEELLIDYNL